MASSSKRKLEWELRIRDQGIKVLEQAEKAVRNLEQSTRDLEGSSTGAATSIGAIFAGGFLGGIAAGAVTAGLDLLKSSANAVKDSMLEAVQVGMQFEEQMLLVGGLGDEAFANLSGLMDDVRATAIETGAGLTDASRGMFNVISATGDAAAANDVLAASAKLAAAGGATLESSTDAVVRTLNAYNLEGSEAARVTDVIFKAQQRGITTVGELSQFLGQVVPVASAAGVEIEELGAAIATTTKVIQSQQALTGLRNLFLRIETAGDDVTAMSRDMAREVGNTTFEFSKAGLQALGFEEFLTQLGEVTQGNAGNFTALGLGVRDMGAALQIVSNDGKTFREEMKQMEDSAGTVDEAFERFSDSSQFKMKQLGTTMEVLQTLFFDEVAPMLNEALSSVVVNFDVLKAGVKLTVAVLKGAFDNMVLALSPVVRTYLDFFGLEGIRALRLFGRALEKVGLVSKGTADDMADMADAGDAFIAFLERAEKEAAGDQLQNALDFASAQIALSQAINNRAKAEAKLAKTQSDANQSATDREAAKDAADLAAAQELAARQAAGIAARFAGDVSDSLSGDQVASAMESLRNQFADTMVALDTLGRDQTETELARVELKYARLRENAKGNSELLAQISENEMVELFLIEARGGKRRLDEQKKTHDKRVKDATAFIQRMNDAAEDSALQLRIIDLNQYDARVAEARAYYDEQRELALGNKDVMVAIAKAEAAEIKLINEERKRDQEEKSVEDMGFGEAFRATVDANLESVTNAGILGQRAANTLSSSMEAAFGKIITGSGDAKSAFKEMAKAILSDVAKLVAKFAANALLSAILPGAGGGLSGLLGAASQGSTSAGGAVGGSGGAVDATASDGGVFNRPTRVLLGEQGPEAVIPLKGGRVPVASDRAANRGPSEQVVMQFHIQAVDAPSFQAMLSGEQNLLSDLIADALSRRTNLRQAVKLTR